MPMPKKNKDETSQEFISRCMDNDIMKKDFQNNPQRLAVCLKQSESTITPKNKASIIEQVHDIAYEKFFGSEEYVENIDTMYIPQEEEYEDFGEEIEVVDFSFAKYIYRDPVTNELYFFERKSSYRKNGRNLIYVSKAAEYQGRKVQLNKPFRTPDGPKKFSVYVKNERGNIVKVNFGDPNMKIKKNIPERRKSFRARHNCDSPGPKWKARYWSCKAW
jgi:hypothetical protein